jgi:pyrimidine operon attenuation protein/uracil phosphoribosyltransferase
MKEVIISRSEEKLLVKIKNLAENIIAYEKMNVESFRDDLEKMKIKLDEQVKKYNIKQTIIEPF